jgi:hypothetical protein
MKTPKIVLSILLLFFINLNSLTAQISKEYVIKFDFKLDGNITTGFYAPFGNFVFPSGSATNAQLNLSIAKPFYIGINATNQGREVNKGASWRIYGFGPSIGMKFNINKQNEISIAGGFLRSKNIAYSSLESWQNMYFNELSFITPIYKKVKLIHKVQFIFANFRTQLNPIAVPNYDPYSINYRTLSYSLGVGF